MVSLMSFHLSLLLIIGLLGHIFVFVQNDYYDIEVDRQSKYVVQRPLTSGVISRTQRTYSFSQFFFPINRSCCRLFLLHSFLYCLITIVFLDDFVQ